MNITKKLLEFISCIVLLTILILFGGNAWAMDSQANSQDKYIISFNDNEIRNHDAIKNYEDIKENSKLHNADDKTVVNLITNILVGKIQAQNLYIDVPFRELFDYNDGKLDTSIEFFIDNAELFGKMRLKEKIIVSDNELVYDFTSISFNDNDVTVAVTELYSFQINGIKDRSSVSTDYSFILNRNEEGVWTFRKISSNDWFEQAMQGRPFDVETKLAEMTEEKPEENYILLNDTFESQQKGMTSTVVTNDYSVNSARVYNYAKNFWNYYNSALYGNYNGAAGGDCMNFASQCLAVGLGFSSDATSIANGYAPCDKVGTYKWYPHTTQFTNCTDFRNYISNNTNETGLFGSVFESHSSSVTCSAGDIVFTENDSGDPYGHAAVVISGGSTRSTILVSAHNNNRDGVTMAWMCGSATTCKVCHPTNFKIYSNCSGHTYSSLPSADGMDSICNNCGYSRLRINATTLPLVTVGATKSISGVVNLNCYRIAVGIKNPYGNTTWLSPYSSGYSYNYSYNFSIPGIYTITISARDTNPDISGSTAKSFVYQVRVTN